jgi:hypothetical protein
MQFARKEETQPARFTFSGNQPFWQVDSTAQTALA